MAKKEIEPTPEDYETVRRQIESPRESMLATLARVEARRVKGAVPGPRVSCS